VPPFVAFMEPSANPPGQGIGHFLGAMRVDGFRPADDFKANLDNWIERFKNAGTVDETQPVIIPGEPELQAEKDRTQNGIPLVQAVVDDLNTLAQKLGLSQLT
jgi:LDH2 family malate/lactate/ureidoglycolate dehydrogenase